jgi:hypothetical protein
MPVPKPPRSAGFDGPGPVVAGVEPVGFVVVVRVTVRVGPGLGVEVIVLVEPDGFAVALPAGR